MYSVQALWTAVQQRLPICTIVINNGGYGAMRAFSQVLKVKSPPGTDLPDLDFVSVARGMGCAAIRVTRATSCTMRWRGACGTRAHAGRGSGDLNAPQFTSKKYGRNQ